jgi:hypothetical protein
MNPEQSLKPDMVPHENDEAYHTGDEGYGDDDSIKNEEEKLNDWSLRIPPRLKLPKLKSPQELPLFLVIVEKIIRELGFAESDFDRLVVKMEIINAMIDCNEIYSTAMLLIVRPWSELRQYLINCFASVARMRSLANDRLSKLSFDRDLIANRIRSLYEWFSVHDSSMSDHEFIARVFSTKVFPAKYLEKIIERAETRYSGSSWRSVPVWQLCDIVEEVCLLFAEIDAVSSKQDRSDNTRRVRNDQRGSSSESSGWLESWLKEFKKVYYVSDPQVASAMRSKADDSRRMVSKRTSKPYFLVAFKDEQVARNSLEGVDADTCREFKLRKPLN